VKRLVSDLAAEIPSLRQSILTALTNVTGSHLLDTELYDFRNFEPIIKKIPPGHGSIEKELDAVFDHSEPGLGTANFSLPIQIIAPGPASN